MIRRRLFGASLILLIVALSGWAARVPRDAPILPAHQVVLHGASFRVVIGAGALDEDALNVGSVGDDNSALQSHPLDHVAAAEFPLLRYRFAHFPRSLELSIIFRRADAPDDVHVVAIPWPGEYGASYDLSALPEWRGDIVELGFAEFPTGQLVPPREGFKPFTLVRAELWTPSWRGALGALVTDWFGYWPWSQRSVHALGRDTDTPRARSAELVIAVGVTLFLMLGVGLLGWRADRLARIAVATIAIAWLALDLRWQTGLWAKHEATRALYAGKPWEERARLVADIAIVDAAERVRQLLRQEPESTRVLVLADSPYELMRMAYHLLPVNVGLLSLALPSLPKGGFPTSCIFVFYNDRLWRYESSTRVLVFDGGRVPVTAMLEAGPLRIYRYRSEP